MSEKYIVIGDIHGRYDLLDELINKIGDLMFLDASIVATGHKFVFLGDLVDRGPDSYKVVDRVKKMHEKGSAIVVRGNHEDMMIDYYNNKVGRFDRYDLWISNGGDKTIDSYTHEKKVYGRSNFFSVAHEHVAWLKSLPYFYETDEIFMSHAPVPTDEYLYRDLDYRLNVSALTWSYHGDHGVAEDKFARDHGKLAVCGHVAAVREGILTPRIYPHIVYADTGCGLAPWCPLTAVIIEDGKYKRFIQAYPDFPVPEKYQRKAA